MQEYGYSRFEGRARGQEYVDTVVRNAGEAIDAILPTTKRWRQSLHTSQKRPRRIGQRLARVFNRGFLDGYYQGQTLGEWNDFLGSKATEKKVYAAKAIKYFSKIGVAEFRWRRTR